MNPTIMSRKGRLSAASERVSLSRRRVRRRRLLGTLLAAASMGVALPAAAQAQHHVSSQGGRAETTAVGAPLSLVEAAALARRDQPATAAFELEAKASEQAAVAARSLPDPEITAGIQNFPIEGDNAFSPVKDDMTMYTIGVMREQVRRSRREAEAARLRADALVSRSEATAQQWTIQRDVMLAWVDAVEAIAKQRVLGRLIGDLKVGQQVMEAGVPTGGSTPSLALQAQAEVALANAQLEDARGQEAGARAKMRRWIGTAADRPLPSTIPVLDPPAVAEADLTAHPHVLVAQAQEEAARKGIDVAREDGNRTISWSVMYGFRPKYGDMISGTVSIPLRINKKNLQNRRVAEAVAKTDAARLRAVDARRELSGSYSTAIAEYKSAAAQLKIIDQQAIPSLEASFEAAEARYASGQGTLEMPLTIVRRYVETVLQSVEQQGRRARAAAELIYLTQDVAR